MKRRSPSCTPACWSFLLLLSASPAWTEPATDSPIDWIKGPAVGRLGTYAEIQVPEGFLFTDRKGTIKLLELTQNIPNGYEVGAMIPVVDEKEEMWFVTFDFNPVGFVKDDERDKIVASSLLESIQKGTEEANKMRREKGWGEFHVVGWSQEPFYDPRTNNLTWAILGRSDDGEAVNHSVRILGRRGTMNVDLVLSPARYTAVVPAFESLLNGFKFSEGQRYADFMKGDRVAAYGLTALIAGGAGAVAVKTGLLAKFWKLLVGILLVAKKALIALVIGTIALFRKIFGRFGKRSADSPPTVAGQGEPAGSDVMAPTGEEPPPGTS
jgi:uncharacterized membrane-anchored protein